MKSVVTVMSLETDDSVTIAGPCELAATVSLQSSNGAGLVVPIVQWGQRLVR